MPFFRSALLLAGSGATLVNGLYSGSTPVAMVKSADFQKVVKDNPGPVLVEFYASWCGHCKQLAPEYEKAAKALKGVVTLAATEDEALMPQYGVKGFPTIKWFGMDKNKPEDFQGERSANGIVSWVMDKTKSYVNQKLTGKASSGGSSGGGGGSGKSDVVELTDSNFDKQVMGDSKHAWFLEFYAPWCGHCKTLAPAWESVATKLKGKVKVAKIDATVEKALGGRFGVQGFPTLKMMPPGKKTDGSAMDYNGGRDEQSLVQFAMKYYSVESEQLLTQKQYEENCDGTGNLCLIAFLPHIIETTASERNAVIKAYNEAAKSAAGIPSVFFWSQGGDQYEFEEKMNLGFGFPALIAINKKKNIFVVHRGTFDEKGMKSFLAGLGSPKHVQDLPKVLPALQKAIKWDGKDAPKEEEVELEL